jgi:hypothetical protein
LSENTVFRNGKNKGSNQVPWLKGILVDLMHPVNGKRAAKTCIETGSISKIEGFGDSAYNLSTDWHLSVEFK